MHVEVRVGQVGQRIRMAASVASRYALGADGVGAAHPGARGSRVTASRYALGAEGGGAALGRLHVLPAYCARCLLGGVGMSKTSCAARCSRGSVQGVLRTPAEGEGGVAHRENFSAAASATLERSAGTVAHGKRAARPRAASPTRQGLAPPARRGRRARVPRDSNERLRRPGRGPLECGFCGSFYLGVGFPVNWGSVHFVPALVSNSQLWRSAPCRGARRRRGLVVTHQSPLRATACTQAPR